MPSFLRNPFQSSLATLVSDLTPSHRELSVVQSAQSQIEKVLNSQAGRTILPELAEKALILVGSRYRDTDIAPLSHIDLFLVFSQSEVMYHEADQTLTISEKKHPLDQYVDGSLHVLPQKIIQGVQQIFSKEMTELTNTRQAVVIPLNQLQMNVRITPAFLSNDIYYIPEEKSELKWRKVAPQKEKEFLDRLNTRHNNFLTPAIRCMKYWNHQKNNSTLRNYHIEASGYFIFEEIPTPISSLLAALSVYAKHLSKYMYTCPDPTGLASPIHNYLPDNVNQWYLYMNRISDLKKAIDSGEKTLVELLHQQTD